LTIARQCRVGVRNLRKNCSPSVFKFNNTGDINPLKGIIGQDRAVRSLVFGLNIDKKNYNIYLAGPFGTGKTTLATDMIKDKAEKESIPFDWCYVHNFKNPGKPKTISLPAGVGAKFKRELNIQIERIVKLIVKTFESEEYDLKKNEILNLFVEKTNALYMKLDEEARALGFSISRSQNGISSVPLKDGEALSQDDYMSMSDEERHELMKRSAAVQEIINTTLRQYRDLEKNFKESIKHLENETARYVAVPYFEYLFQEYRDFQQVVEHIEVIQQDLLDNIEFFVKPDDNMPAFLRHIDKKASLRKYQVNLIVDNSGLRHAPIVFESNPTYASLFGQIDYEGEFGILTTDFSKIKSGALHRANGGYLVLNVTDVLKNFYTWEALKRALREQTIKIESLSKIIGISSTETLEPEPIPLNVKILLIGDPVYYHLLFMYDEEVKKLFKIKADFDTVMDRNRQTINDYAKFISAVCKKNNLKSVDRSGVASIVDYGTRLAGDQNKLSTLFDKITEIICEADYWATDAGEEIITAEHVKKAITEKIFRSSMMEEKIQEYIEKDIIIINSSGSKVGELNGLAVYQMGDYTFGKPVRITAKTFMGEKGLVNIEREIRLSGSIHSKGVLTLNGYMGAQYAQEYPLSLSASLTFEQSYQGIEGDSASSAELYALLSSLAEVPINQGIAVTGSVNQNGEIQPVGGINEKIEGFFAVCQSNGFTGKQGVIIPRQNIRNLMLSDEVVEAVRARKFNIWAVEHIDQGLEIITGISAGCRDDRGNFTYGSIHYLVDKKLKEWSLKVRTNNYSNNKQSVVGTKPVKRRRRR